MVTEKEKQELIRKKFAKNLDDTEFELFMYQCNKYELDPLVGEIWAIKYGKSPAQIFTSRDGFLAIAQRSGLFNGLNTYMKDDETAVCEVRRKDMEFPIIVEVDMEEYSTGKSLWASKPKTMLKKVAEMGALRRAFNVHGLYGIEEFGEIEKARRNKTPQLPASEKPSSAGAGAFAQIPEKVEDPNIQKLIDKTHIAPPSAEEEAIVERVRDNIQAVQPKATITPEEVKEEMVECSDLELEAERVSFIEANVLPAISKYKKEVKEYLDALPDKPVPIEAKEIAAKVDPEAKSPNDMTLADLKTLVNELLIATSKLRRAIKHSKDTDGDIY